MIVLGSVVEDYVTGFSGIATGRAEFLHGVPRVQIERRQPAMPGVGPMTVCEWFEEGRVQVVKPASPT